MLLGAAVAAALDAKGWTQVRLAGESGIPQGRISAMCRGYRGERPTYEELQAIETAMGLPAGYFYGFAGLATSAGARRGAEAAARLAQKG